MADEMKGVWLPVPKKRATRGYTIRSPKSFYCQQTLKSLFRDDLSTFEKRNMLSMLLTGIIANTGSKALMILSTVPNLLISDPNLEIINIYLQLPEAEPTLTYQ